MWNLATLFRRSNEWRFYEPFNGDLLMRRRDQRGQWEYRQPTRAEVEEFDDLRAW